ncbi:unnamed protein product, partial [Meganyctiphanes norvegica]
MRPHMVIAVLAPLCGSSIPMGFNTGVLNLPQKYIRQWIQVCLLEKYNKILTSNEEVILWTAIVSTFLVGAMIGSLKCSSIADKIGRRRTFLISHIICLVESVLFSSSFFLHSIEMFIIGRLLAGLCGGIASSLVPVYFSEVFPCKLKGVSGVVHAAGICIGILLSIIAGMDTVLGNETLWEMIPIVTFLGSVGSLLVHPFITETPAYTLLNSDNVEKTSKILQKLRSNKNEAQVEMTQLEELKAKNQLKNKEDEKWDLTRILKNPELKKMLLNVVLLFGSQQLSGINGCWFYSSMLFSQAGLDTFQSNLAAIFAGTINCIMCVVSFFISRKYPRRKVLLTSISGCVLNLFGLSISMYFSKLHFVIPYITISFFIMFITSFCIGLAPIPYIMTVEMMPEGPRSVAMSIGASVMWSCNLIVSLSFYSLNYCLGSFSLFIFISILIVCGIYFYVYLPETLIRKDNKLLQIFYQLYYYS